MLAEVVILAEVVMLVREGWFEYLILSGGWQINQCIKGL